MLILKWQRLLVALLTPSGPRLLTSLPPVGESLSISKKKLFCNVCREEVGLKSSCQFVLLEFYCFVRPKLPGIIGHL